MWGHGRGCDECVALANMSIGLVSASTPTTLSNTHHSNLDQMMYVYDEKQKWIESGINGYEEQEGDMYVLRWYDKLLGGVKLYCGYNRSQHM